MEPTSEPERGGALYRALDLLSVAATSVCALILVLPSVDVPLLGGHFIRFSGIKNPLIVVLTALLLMLVIWPEQRPLLVRGLERMRERIPATRRRLLLTLAGALLLQNLFYGADATIMGDGLCYYAYLRSSVLQRNLDFTDEFRDYNYGNINLPDIREKTATGMVSNPYSIGPAVLWLPFFLAGHADAILTGEPRDGYSRPYVESIILGSQFYGLLGLWLTLRIVECLVPRGPSVLATLGLWFASPMVEYYGRSGSMSHAHSVFTVSLFLFLYLRSAGKRTPAGWLALGVAGGLAFLVRWQDATFCLLPLFDLFRGRRLRDALADAYLYGAAFLIVALPQLLVFKVIFGGWLTVPQGRDFIGLVPAYLWQVLFSTNHGLLVWHPVFLLALLGLILGVAGRIPHLKTLAAGFLLQLLVNASVEQWWAGHAFGGRRFLSCFPIFAVGLCVLLARPWMRGWRTQATILPLCLLNNLMRLAWIKDLLPHEGTFGLSRAVSAFTWAIGMADPKELAILALAGAIAAAGARLRNRNAA